MSVLLGLWISGIFIFATALNWTINARSLLPALPAVGILAARQMERKNASSQRGRRGGLVWPALAAGAISLLLVTADCRLANALRGAALELGAKYCGQGKAVWFQGHSGFQYYIERFGAKAVEQASPGFAAGDVVIVPSWTARVRLPADQQLRLVETRQYAADPHFSTFNLKAGAGFYATVIGPLPFAVKGVEPEVFEIYEVIPTDDRGQAGAATGAGSKTSPSPRK